MKNQDQNSRAHDILLLMFNLSQITIKEKIIDVFVGAVGEIWPDRNFKYLPVKQFTPENSIEISASGSNYGFLSINDSKNLHDEDLALLHYAVALLAVILRKNEQDALLADEKLHLQKLIETTLRERENEFRTLAEAKKKVDINEARLKMALEVSHSGAWDWDIRKNTFYWSDEFLHLFGLPECTIAGIEAWIKAVHPEDIESASKKDRKSTRLNSSD